RGRMPGNTSMASRSSSRSQWTSRCSRSGYGSYRVVRNSRSNADHNKVLLACIDVVGDQSFCNVDDPRATDCIKHLIDFVVAEAEMASSFDGLDDALCY